MSSINRQKGINLLYKAYENIDVCRKTEAYCHSHSETHYDYWDNIRRASFNMTMNPNLNEDLVISSDTSLIEGTILEKRETERENKRNRFEQMLKDKYDAIDDVKVKSVAKCRKCNSQDITWQEKQTRSADEGATLFVTCNACKNRWVVK